jgi:hypothetical protein
MNDMERNICTTFMQCLDEYHGIHRHTTSAYHLWSDKECCESEFEKPAVPLSGILSKLLFGNVNTSHSVSIDIWNQ